MSTTAQLAEAKALRNAARALVEADIARLKGDVDRRSIPARAMDRATEGAVDVLEQVSEAAARHKGLVAAAVGALALWLARHPLLALLDDEDEPAPDSPSPEDETDVHS